MPKAHNVANLGTVSNHCYYINHCLLIYWSITYRVRHYINQKPYLRKVKFSKSRNLVKKLELMTM